MSEDKLGKKDNELINKVAGFCIKLIGQLDIPGKQFQDFFDKIKAELEPFMSQETKEKIEKSVNRVIDLSKEGLKLIANDDFKAGLDQFKSAGKEVLSCIGNVFAEIKKGLENGFDKVKHGLGAACKQLESLLGKGKGQSI